jgi:MOSC domain-containing protein YiiM
MTEVDNMSFTTGEGIIGDSHRLESITKHYSRNASVTTKPTRQVLLMDRETLQKFELADGELRENITITGLKFSNLSKGDLLNLGPEVQLEITGICKPCPRLEEIRTGLEKAISSQRGLLAYTKSGGTLTVGDSVIIV